MNRKVPRSEALHPFEQLVSQLGAEQASRFDRWPAQGHRRASTGAWSTVLPPVAPSFGARCIYDVPGACAPRETSVPVMIEAVRQLEAALSSRSLSAADVKRLRRAVALSVHPDLHDGPDRQTAEQLMTSVNVLVAVSLGRS